MKSPETLLRVWFECIGRGANLILNVPPDRRGLLHETDMASLAGFGQMLKQTFAANVLKQVKTATTADSITAALPRASKVSVFRIRENIRLGHRIDDWDIQIQQGDDWRTVAQGTAIGACRLVRLEQPAAAQGVRLRFLKTSASPEIAEFSAY